MLPCHGSETGSTPVCSANYGTAPINVIENKGVFLIAGWSDKIFEFSQQLRMEVMLLG